MVLEGFVDDSGITHDKVAVLAGFLSTAERWTVFSDALESLCEREPKTPDFKMQKAHDFRAYYPAKRWQLDKRIEDVANLIREHAMYRLDVVLSRPAYNGIVKGRINPKIDSPYFLLFYTIILETAELMNKLGMEGTADFIFDDQGKIGQECASFYEEIKKRVDERIGRRLGSRPIFRHDKEILPIKAADVLAWQLRRHLDIEQPQDIEHNQIVDDALAMYGVSCHITNDHLRDFMRNASHGLVLRSECQFHLPDGLAQPDRFL
ncbi:MAG TPA: DUF3800 domain-containing protein [Terriglobia bacterium]|nr:DUF3800 domain-containing protein [Terriglobia bacterium]